jgi:hypothetical protein
VLKAKTRILALDLGIALGDLLEMERVSGKVLPECEQMLHAILAGQRRHQLPPGSVAARVAMDRQPLGIAFSVQDARLFELRATASLAHLLRGQGKSSEAWEMLAEIYGWFTQGFEFADLKDAKALLEELKV